MTPLLLSYLFNLFVFAFILFIWVTFIRNLVRTLRKEKGRNIKRPAPVATPSTASRAQRDNRNRNAHKQPAQTTHVANKDGGHFWQEILKKDPQEIHHLLRAYLPESFHKDLTQIFNSERPMKALVNFLRRPDVWPLLKSFPSQIESSVKTQKNLFQPKTASIAPSVSEDNDENYDAIADTEKDAATLSAEVDQVVVEYDQFAEYFKSMLDDVPSSPIPEKTASQMKLTDADRPAKKLNQAWLRDAVLGSIILEKPDY